MPVYFLYNSLKRLRKQRSLRRWPHWFGELRAQLGPFFGYISPCIPSFGLCWTFIAPPAHGRDTGAFPKHSWPASWCRWLGSPLWQNYKSGASHFGLRTSSAGHRAEAQSLQQDPMNRGRKISTPPQYLESGIRETRAAGIPYVPVSGIKKTFYLVMCILSGSRIVPA